MANCMFCASTVGENRVEVREVVGGQTQTAMVLCSKCYALLLRRLELLTQSTLLDDLRLVVNGSEIDAHIWELAVRDDMGITLMLDRPVPAAAWRDYSNNIMIYDKDRLLASIETLDVKQGLLSQGGVLLFCYAMNLKRKVQLEDMPDVTQE